jgi:hypothetical protein
MGGTPTRGARRAKAEIDEDEEMTPFSESRVNTPRTLDRKTLRGEAVKDEEDGDEMLTPIPTSDEIIAVTPRFGPKDSHGVQDRAEDEGDPYPAGTLGKSTFS